MASKVREGQGRISTNCSESSCIQLRNGSCRFCFNSTIDIVIVKTFETSTFSTFRNKGVLKSLCRHQSYLHTSPKLTFCVFPPTQISSANCSTRVLGGGSTREVSCSLIIIYFHCYLVYILIYPTHQNESFHTPTTL